MYIGSYIFNLLCKLLAGREPALDPPGFLVNVGFGKSSLPTEHMCVIKMLKNMQN